MQFKCLLASMALVVGLASPGLTADIMITVNGTIIWADAGMGYTAGQSVSFTWVVNDFAPATPTGTAEIDDYYQWTQESAGTEPRLLASVSGTGIGGTYVEPPNDVPYETLKTDVESFLAVAMNTDDFNVTTNNHGIYLNADSSYFVQGLSFEGGINAGYGNFTSTLPNPTEYLSNYLGTFVVEIGNGFITAGNGSTALAAAFQPTSVTVAQVPEPSTYALGTIAAGTLAWLARRRKTQAKA